MNPTKPITESLPSHYKNFSCGEPVLDEYLKRFAKDHEKIGIGRTFVLPDENKNIIGYYTLCAAQITINDLPIAFRKKMPKYPVPSSRLCRLAVDRSFQGKHIGEYLLTDAIKRVLRVDVSVAMHSIIVDAKSDKAKQFYLKYGFLPLEGRDLNLFLPMVTIRESIN